MEKAWYIVLAERLAPFFLRSQAMRSSRVKILKIHFQCREHTATARQLSELLGYKSYHAVNLQYGLFVKSLAQEFGWPGSANEQRNFDWLFFLMDFYHPLHGECLLRLRENTVRALQDIGW